MRSTNTKHKILAAFLVALFIGLFAYNFNHGERIQFQDGLGWDGSLYAGWAQRDSKEVILSKTVPAYYIGRLLPSVIVHNVSNLLRYDISYPVRVIQAFYIYNFGLLLIAGFFTYLIGRHFEWHLPTYFLACTALFINYPVLKNASYNPTLVDISAYVISLVIFYFYLRDRVVPLSISIIVGAFIWPTLLYGTVPLLAFGKAPFKSDRVKLHANILALLIPLLWMSLAGYLYFFEGLRQQNGTTPIRLALFPASVILLMGYMYFVVRPFTDVGVWFSALRGVRWYRVGLAAVLFVAIKWVIGTVAAPGGDPLTITSYIGLLTQASVANPLVNVIAHAQHYGPFYVLAIMLWPQVSSIVKEQGAGLVFYIALFALLSAGAESRQFINAWPIVAVIVCEALRRRMGTSEDWAFYYSVLAIALVVSRFWLDINVGPWTGKLLEFPDQMLFMYTGPWMSNRMYEVFVAVTLLMTVALAALLRNLQPGTAGDRSPQH
ncbi:hypothetical protein [Pandoraea pulmonicola]|uniref:Uncharacterized protein n=1 Tax=Pandoraea pulmonicola TaxID=93221 RepID=A0AAJ4ZH54_PANPU|nr:hypothetical protein [Pandoraea pulmonicola]AJC22650.1 hypothetical protein RO07_23235 [Pandoraea pulmonicola]SUA93121.1 Uncharacterised protein [Pandoraea pulmonicola]